MISLSEYLELRQAAMPCTAWLNQATATSLATPDVTDTKRAIDRAAKRGRAVTPDDLRAGVSPESEEATKKGIMRLSASHLSRDSGSSSGPVGNLK